MTNLTEAAAGNGAGSGRYAIVGYGFRMPGGIGTAGDFWQLLSGRGFAAAHEGLMRGDEPYLFDAGLFGLSARAASTLEPSLRMLLTCTWEALEQAGWDHAELPGSRTGMFVSSLDVPLGQLSSAFSLMGLPGAYLTACSSGVTALHAAVTALGHRDCDQAIVGAASEGVFVYLVKPLATAERDGDRILALIAGTAVNTASTQPAQASLMRAACARAGLSPGDVDYIEAHATGSLAGDRIEGNAIRAVFGGEDRAVPLRMASVKSNVGHMEAAAFTCALLKVLLMFEHRTYAPVSGQFAVPSPDIDFTGVRVQTECEPFGAGPVTVGINSFGSGGASGHCLLTEYRPDRGRPGRRPAAPDAAYLIPLSARTPEALTQTAAALHDLITNEPAPDLDLYTLAGNLSRRRTHFAARAAFAAASLPQLAERLDAFARDPSPASPRPASDGTGRSGPPRILMVFAGQGTQWAGCGRALYDTEPVFRRAVDAVDAAWRDLAGFSLRDACFTASQEDLDEVQLAQPVIFLIEVALAELLKTWGVHPDGVIGHSAGEVAAAYAAGIYSLAEATRLIFHRAVLQQRTAGSGRLLAVSLDRAGTADLLAELGDPDLEIACENAPASTVIGGPGAAVAAARPGCGQRRVPHRLLAATSPSTPAPWTSSRRTCAPRSPSSTAARSRPRSRSSPA